MVHEAGLRATFFWLGAWGGSGSETLPADEHFLADVGITYCVGMGALG